MNDGEPAVLSQLARKQLDQLALISQFPRVGEKNAPGPVAVQQGKGLQQCLGIELGRGGGR